MAFTVFFSKTVGELWLQPRSPAAKPSADIVAAELVAASSLGLCFDGFHGVFLKDSGAKFMVRSPVAKPLARISG